MMTPTVPPLPALMLNYDVFNVYSKWCVYSHVVDNQLIWIGLCRYSDLLSAPDVRKNIEWQKRVKGKNVMLTLFAEYDDLQQAQHDWSRAVSDNRPICNFVNSTSNKHQKIMCIETGVVYQSQTEVARIHGVTNGAISNHLNGHGTQKTVKGLTFKRL